MFKGGTRIEDIAMRIVRGIPGSPMPANADIAAADLWSTAAYVKTFAQQGTMEARSRRNRYPPRQPALLPSAVPGGFRRAGAGR